jgi:putative membrane protein
MTWLVLKALHVAAVVTWAAGLLMLALLLGILATAPAVRLPQERRVALALLAWDRRATAPAMLMAWALGLAMASHAGWFGAPWLQAKLVLALLLSGGHGLLAGTLRRLTAENGRAPSHHLRHVPLGIVVATALVAVLVVIKPG